MVEMAVSAAIQDYGYRVVRHWRVAPTKEEPYQSPIHAIEEKQEQKEPFKIELAARGSDIKNGTFGLEGCCKFSSCHFSKFS